ncbi:hypothetical protein JI735_31055 [Paenibacillus sonchi]|uniref:Uncharacterized protein n=1 Tax=Paenibacillus sonchi TaxID=373687 RepID=A0A974SCG5_9BACL|nr:hypothetical protein [Paenibacillus sonchi]QQZ60837.1 hypothetical protein JI735_31055 [Paenibacillus sonchi]
MRILKVLTVLSLLTLILSSAVSAAATDVNLPYTVLDTDGISIVPAGEGRVILNNKFEEKYDTASGWKSELFGSQLYVKDESAHFWSLYDLTGKSILSNQPAPPASGHEAHFIGLDTTTREASFAIFSSSGHISVITLPVK